MTTELRRALEAWYTKPTLPKAQTKEETALAAAWCAEREVSGPHRCGLWLGLLASLAAAAGAAWGLFGGVP